MQVASIQDNTEVVKNRHSEIKKIEVELNLMQNIGFIEETEYYDKIIDFYTETTHNSMFTQNEIWTWQEKTIIQLMNDIKTHKKLKNADIKDVAKNCILLLLKLFNNKNRTDSNFDELNEQDRRKVIEILCMYE
jgi:hypothetical protein